MTAVAGDRAEAQNDCYSAASYQTRKGRCNTLNCCMFLSVNRVRFTEIGSSQRVASPVVSPL
ncbi:hypothetical protein EHS39_06450 [Ensifer sp. MPMI2T]|nr:hypothetical protein EHS39_06450 [Ensifer sp. MPMI2T]